MDGGLDTAECMNVTLPRGESRSDIIHTITLLCIIHLLLPGDGATQYVIYFSLQGGGLKGGHRGENAISPAAADSDPAQSRSAEGMQIQCAARNCPCLQASVQYLWLLLWWCNRIQEGCG